MDLEFGHNAAGSFEAISSSLELFILPAELVVHILLFLPAADIAHFSTTSRTSHVLVTSSPTLSYKLQLHLGKAEDNPKNRLVHREKLRLLRKQIRSWLHCEPDFSITVPVTFDEGSIYDLSGGAYFLGQLDRRTLRYIDLPTRDSENVDWKSFKPRKNQEEIIIDFTVNRYEHDMICLITGNRFTVGPLAVVYLKLSIYQFSTGNYHPLSKEPVQTLVGPESDWGTPAVYCEIAGDIIVLVTNFRIGVSSPCVTVYHWKTGTVLLQLSGTETYEGIVFLDEKTIVLPKISGNVLEIWKIPDLDESPPDFPSRCLCLFDTAPNCSIQYISCRADPNPKASAALLNSDRPFHYLADDAIILFHVWVRNGLLGATLVTLLVHRKALLEISSQSRGELDLAPTSPTPWSTRAPGITLCFDAGGAVPSRWITEACGQRFVYLQVDSEDEGEEDRPPTSLVILDFDPDRIREVEREMELDDEEQREDRDTYGPVIIRGPHKLRERDRRLFTEEIVSYLPYVESRTKEKYTLDSVMLDQERVVGLKIDPATNQTFFILVEYIVWRGISVLSI